MRGGGRGRWDSGGNCSLSGSALVFDFHDRCREEKRGGADWVYRCRG